MKTSAFYLSLFFMLLFFCSGCSDQPSSDDNTVSQPIEIRYPDQGDFKALYRLFRTNHPAKPVIDELRRTKAVDDLVSQLNTVFKLPHDLIIQFRESDTINAWYDPNTRYIHFTSSFIDLFYSSFAPYYRGPELVRKVHNVVVYFLLHEIGHALVDIYDIPVTGPEEDMVDFFSVCMLTGNDQSEEAIIDAANIFFELSRPALQVQLSKLPLWDEHSLELQRFYTILSLLYGKNPEKYSYLAAQRILPDPDKNEGYPFFYNRVMNGWSRVLEKFLIQKE
jgi:hypothetical protein